MTATQTELVCARTGLGQAWIPLELVVPHVQPQDGPLYRVGMLIGRVDLLLTIACSN